MGEDGSPEKLPFSDTLRADLANRFPCTGRSFRGQHAIAVVHGFRGRDRFRSAAANREAARLASRAPRLIHRGGGDRVFELGCSEEKSAKTLRSFVSHRLLH